MWDTALFVMCPITIRSIIIMRFGLFWWLYTKWIQDATRILLSILTIVTEYLRHKWPGNVLMAIQSISYSWLITSFLTSAYNATHEVTPGLWWSSCCSICPLWGTSIAINRRFLIKCVNNFRSMTSSMILLKINEYRWVLCNLLMWKENWLKNVNNFKMEAKTILLPC